MFCNFRDKDFAPGCFWEIPKDGKISLIVPCEKNRPNRFEPPCSAAAGRPGFLPSACSVQDKPDANQPAALPLPRPLARRRPAGRRAGGTMRADGQLNFRKIPDFWPISSHTVSPQGAFYYFILFSDFNTLRRWARRPPPGRCPRAVIFWKAGSLDIAGVGILA